MTVIAIVLGLCALRVLVETTSVLLCHSPSPISKSTGGLPAASAMIFVWRAAQSVEAVYPQGFPVKPFADIQHVGRLLASVAHAEIMPRFRNLTPAGVREKSSAFDVVTEANEAAEEAIARA
ncbi:MAG: hypothetical protein J0J01_11965 [Reyranella sp.]|uniref:hypothetical protein n=1 Tax=Reyranella sp. TaxID=1929291 RepID=UPI001ACE19CE|nr:hypothetical protein [Reyranella sp.]MBN9087617.1 hypothetical protein [Reyranella sp.]